MPVKCNSRRVKEYTSLNDINKGNRLPVHYDFRATLEAITSGYSWLMQKIYELLETIDQMEKICTMYWMPAYVGKNGNESADKLAKEARDLNNNTTSLVTLGNANAIACY